MILTYKYRIKDKSARKALRRHADAVNQVWNYCVSIQRQSEDRFRAGLSSRRWPTHFDLTRLTAGSSQYFGILAQTIQCVCKQFTSSRRRGKKRPSFRRSGAGRRSLGWIPFQPQSCAVSGNAVRYCGRDYRFWLGDRPVPLATRGGCFCEDARGNWYICFNIEVCAKLETGPGTIGIDLGLKTLATCSDGSSIPAMQHYRQYERRLAAAQRAGNKRRVQAVHAKIANARRDQLHKASAKIARANALIAIGNVSSSSLTKTRMAKSVLDAGWSMFRSQLRYKASRHGAVYLDIDEKFTTQTCSECGALPPERPKGIAGLGIRAWDCSACGASHDRDVNAARNILALALGAQRRADESRKLAKAATG